MGEETKKCPTCGTEVDIIESGCFNCGTRFPEQPESNETQDENKAERYLQEPESTGEVAGEKAEGEEVKQEGAVEKLKGIFGAKKVEVKDENAGEEQVEVKTGEMSSEPQNSQEQE